MSDVFIAPFHPVWTLYSPDCIPPTPEQVDRSEIIQPLNKTDDASLYNRFGQIETHTTCNTINILI